MIKAILFDIGGVLLRTQDHSFRHKWDKALGVSPGTVEQAVFNSQMGTAAQLGQITTPALWQWLGKEFSLSDEQLAQLKHDFWAGDALDWELVSLIRQLHGRYKTAVISNYSDSLPHLIHNEWQIGDAFDLLTVSALEQVMKPDPAIYQRTLSRLDLPPEQTIFIDDFAHNIKGANDVGMAGIHFTQGVNLRYEFATFGIHTPE